MDKSTRDAILAEANAAKAIWDTAERETRELSDVEQDTIKGHLTKASKIETDFKNRVADEAKRREEREAFRKQFLDLTAGVGYEPGADPDRKMRVAEPQERGRKSVGELFTGSAEYKSMLGSVPNGVFSEKARVQSAPLAVPGGMKDLFFSGDRTQSAGTLILNQQLGMQDPFYQRPLHIRGLFASGQTTSDTLEYVHFQSVTNGAAVVPEARSAAAIDGTTVTNAIGGLKPQSTFSFSRDTTTVKTIAHWIPITKRALSDAAQMRTYIDSFLRYGLEEEFEDQLVNGSGSGENLLGLNHVSGVQTQAAPATGQDNLDILKMAKTKVQIGGRTQPTAYVMNPLDLQNIELMRDDMGRFYGSGPFSDNQPSIWGLPVVTSEAIAQGTAWCADWNWGVIFDREQASVQATDTHADFFVRNMAAILAEFRAAFAIMRAPAFVKITLG